VVDSLNYRLLVAGGGTGGHLLAGVAVADLWVGKHGDAASVLFVGSRGGIEERLIPRTPYSLRLLNLGSLNRVSAGQKIKTILQLPWAFWTTFRILMTFRPGFVLGVGGYSSGPTVFLAGILKKLGLLRIQVAILEQNNFPGLTNRILGRFVDLVFTAFDGMEAHFPGKKVVFTGNPIRSSMTLMDSAAGDPFTVFIFGGSQGARGVNLLVLDALPHLSSVKSKLKFIHQTGEADYNRVLAGYEAQGLSHSSRIEKFIYDMPECYRAASLLICRAGSSTLSEIAAVGRASILVPLPTAADNHQEKNALAFMKAGAAKILSQTKSDGQDLASLIMKLMKESTQIVEMERRVTQFYRPKAAADIVDRLLE
jgi:UDP-N-acetylglucosamine--N-acetylmuramyl-(pentapeptide) pyrophosphoryl-undecaprenol N-acetylglucosamine transferase